MALSHPQRLHGEPSSSASAVPQVHKPCRRLAFRLPLLQTLSVFKGGDVLPTLLGGGNNLTITIDNGTYVLGDLSEAQISGPPTQACNVSGSACRLSVRMHMHVCVAGAMWRVGKQVPVWHAVHMCMGHPDFPLGGAAHARVAAWPCWGQATAIQTLDASGGHGGTIGL